MTKRIVLSFLLGLVGFLGLGVAHAQTPATYFRTTSQTPSFFRSLDGAEVCIESIRRYRESIGSSTPWTYYGPTVPFATNSSGGCYYKLGTSPGLVNNGGWTKITCKVDAPYFDPAVGCVASQPPPPPPVCKAGEEGTFTWAEGALDSNGNDVGTHYNPLKGKATDGVCELKITEVVRCYTVAPNHDVGYCSYKASKTGSPLAAAADLPAPTTAPTGTSTRKDMSPTPSSSGSCPAGSVQGGTSNDGVPICIGTGTAPKNSPPPPPKSEVSKTETNADGSTTTTTTTTTTNSDGSKTTQVEKVTTMPDGTKNTDVQKDTSTTPTGGAGRDDLQKADDKYDLCKQNPTLTICRNSSVSGTCGDITCMGDAIQCATLRAAAAMQCQQKKELDDLAARPEVAAGNAILSGADPQKGAIDAALKGTEVDLSKPALDSSGFVSSRSCLAPRTMTVGGKSITVSFDSLCNNIEPLRYAVLACAWIVAYLVVSRSVLNS